MSGRRVPLPGIGVFLLLLVCWTVPVSGQGAGAIGGTVTDASGAVLPGAAVTLTNVQGSVGGNQETVSDGRGAYQFLRLVPGTYSVKATLEGFRPVEQRNIVVNADNTARADLMLPIGGLAEGIVVSGQAPLLDTTSALRQTVMTQETLQALPNRGDMWSITRAVPSIVVSKVDVGGSESFKQSGITVHGTSSEGGYFIDGMDIGQTDSAGAGATLYLDPFAFQESNFQAGNAPAESPRGGLVINVITKTGTNQLHGGAQFNGTNHSLGSNNVPAAVSAQILRNIPARILALIPNLQPTADIRYLYDSGAWLGGPLIKDRLWYSASFHHQQGLQYDLGSYNPNGTQVTDDNFILNTDAKLAWQASPTSQLSYFYLNQHKLNGHEGSTSSFQDTSATNHSPTTPQLNQVKWTSSLSTRMVVDTSVSVDRILDANTWPPEAKVGDIAGFDSITNTLLRVLPTFSSNQDRRVVGQVSLSYFIAVHDIKVGYQINQISLNPNIVSASNPPMRAVYRNGVPDSVNTYNLPVTFDEKDREQALYIQDKWKLARKLTVNLGLRMDMNYGWEDAACQAANAFVPARCYAALNGFPDWKAVSPRFSAVYDLAGDGRTALKFSANRYVTPVGTSVVARVNPIAAVSDTRAWTACAPGQTSACDLNGDGLPQINELGPSTGYPVGASNRFVPGYNWPTANEYTAEVQRQLPGNVVATVGFTHRETRNNLGYRNAAVPASAYTPIAVTEVNSGTAVTVFNQDPATKGQFDIVWNNEPALNSTYNGGDITVNRRLGNGWLLTGGVSLGKNVGDIYPAPTSASVKNDLNNPNFTFRRGLAGNDVPFSLRLSSVYTLPLGISASATFQRQSGFPELTTASVGNNTIALTQGSTSVAVAPRGTTRLPTLHQLDASFRKAFRSGSKVLQPRVDLYNLANSATLTSRTTTLGSSYDAANAIQRGRLIKFGISLDF